MHFLILLLAFTFISWALGSNKGEFSLINRASEGIERASVEICGQRFEFGDLPPGGRVSRSYEVGGESHYTIEIRFHSGRHQRAELGYVSSGFDFRDELSVSDTQIVLICRAERCEADPAR
jgi:hypothetical protein